MSEKYIRSSAVPLKDLISRLLVLSDAVTKGKVGIDREFYMSVPAQVDHDADLVLQGAALRLEQFQAENVQLREYVEWVAKCTDTIQHKGYVKNILTKAKCVLEAVREYEE